MYANRYRAVNCHFHNIRERGILCGEDSFGREDSIGTVNADCSLA